MISVKRTMIRLGRGLLCLLPVVCALLLILNLLPGIYKAHKRDVYVATGRSAVVEPITLPDMQDRININTASVEELDKLPGVGTAIAAAIVAEREANGLYFYPEDLMDAKGIGESKYHAVEHLITTGE